MANIIHLNTPTPADIVGQFADRYVQSRRQQQLMDTENRRLGIEQQSADASRNYQQGQLGVARDRLGMEKTQQEHDAEIKMVADWASKAIEPFNDGTPEGRATAQKNLQEFQAAHPNVDVLGIAQRLVSQPTMADRTKANVGKFAETQSGIAAGGGTDPNAVNFATHSALGAFMPNEGFQQQQAADLQARGGGSTAAIPKPTGNAVTDYERRATSAMPTSAENLTADTSIRTTGMQTASAERQNKARLDAAAAAVGEDAKVIAQEIAAGRQPPDLGTRLTKQSGQVRAELGRLGYDLTKAEQDWKATQKYLSTLNGPSQVRLRQAVDFAYESLPLVRDLSKEWDAGGFPLLTKARLIAAKQGVLGPKAQDLAVKLDNQITEVQSEIAIVYRGGNAPTDEAMKKADKILHSDWSAHTMMAALDLIDKNLLIRRNSITSAGTATGAGNRYEPTVTIAAPSGGAGKGNPLGLTPPK